MTSTLIEILRVWNQRGECEGREKKYQTKANARLSMHQSWWEMLHIVEQTQIWLSSEGQTLWIIWKSIFLGSSVLCTRA